MINDDVKEAFRAKAEAAGRGYQTLINEALRAALAENDRPLTANVMREIVREELAHARRNDRAHPWRRWDVTPHGQARRSPPGLGVQRRHYGDRWGYGLGAFLAADPPQGFAIH